VLEDDITVAGGFVVGADGQAPPVNPIPLPPLLTPLLQGTWSKIRSAIPENANVNPIPFKEYT
jgi:hypothetical protein